MGELREAMCIKYLRQCLAQGRGSVGAGVSAAFISAAAGFYYVLK